MPFARVIERVIIADRRAIISDRIAEITEELARLRLEYAALGMDVTASEKETERLRKEIQKLPDVGELLAAMAKLEREIARLKAESKRTEKEFDERCAAYNVVRYTKFYKYPKTPRVEVKRHFEIRAEFTIPREVDPAGRRLLEVIGKKFNGVMNELGITRLDRFKQGWVVGGEKVEELERDPETGEIIRRDVMTNVFESTVISTVEEHIMGYEYTSPTYKTDIEVTEEELTV